MLDRNPGRLTQKNLKEKQGGVLERVLELVSQGLCHRTSTYCSMNPSSFSHESMIDL